MFICRIWHNCRWRQDFLQRSQFLHMGQGRPYLSLVQYKVISITWIPQRVWFTGQYSDRAYRLTWTKSSQYLKKKKTTTTTKIKKLYSLRNIWSFQAHTHSDSTDNPLSICGIWKSYKGRKATIFWQSDIVFSLGVFDGNFWTFPLHLTKCHKCSNIWVYGDFIVI